MDITVESQILCSLKSLNFDEKKFKFVKIKDNILKLCYINKFITYIEISDPNKNEIKTTQTKYWISFRNDLKEYTNKIIDGSAFEIITMIDVNEKDTNLINKTINSLKKQTVSSYLILIIFNQTDLKIAIENNIDFIWIKKDLQYDRFINSISILRSNIKELKNIMFCCSGDCFQNNWINEGLKIIKKEKTGLAGKPNKYLFSDDNNYLISINQEFGKLNIKHKIWKDICFFNGLIIAKIILNKINWDISSKNFYNNLSFGIHEKIISMSLKFSYINTSKIICINNNIKEIFANKNFIIEKIHKIPLLEEILQQENIKNSKHNNEEEINMKMSIEINKKYDIPLIIKKNINTNKIENIEIKDNQIKEKTSMSLTIKNDMNKIPIIIKNKPADINQLNNFITLFQNPVPLLSSPNKIITLILVNNLSLMNICLKLIKEQVVKTDILLLFSNLEFKKNIEKTGEQFLFTDYENEKQKILQGLIYVKKMNPFFVMIIYDHNILHPKWIKDSLAKMKKLNLDIIGTNTQYYYIKSNNKVIIKKINTINMNYIPHKLKDNWSIFEGRIIFNRLLHKLNWNIFLNNLDIDIDVSFDTKLVENAANCNKLENYVLITIIEKENDLNISSNKYIHINNYKSQHFIDNFVKDPEIYEKIIEEYKNQSQIKIDQNERNKNRIVITPIKEIEQNLIELSNNSGMKPINLQKNMEEYYYENLLDINFVSKDIIWNNENLIVQSLWIGEKIEIFEQICILSYINKGHEFHLYTYGPVKNVPKECKVKDANEIIPEKEIFYYSEQQSLSGFKSPAAFSNMFRYKLLYDKGGYWVDTDMVCVKTFDFTDSYVFSSELTNRRQSINAGVIKCPPGSDFAKYCYEICKSKDKKTLKWGEIGPNLVRAGINRFGLMSFVKPWYTFCPISYNALNRLVDPTILNFENRWYAVHLWNEYWKKQKIDKNKISYNFIAKTAFGINIEPILNKVGVLITWIPWTLYHDKYKNNLETRSIYVDGEINPLALDNFIKNDIYLNLMIKFKENKIINDIHVIFTIKDNDLDNYNNKFKLFDRNFVHYKSINFWKLSNLSDLFFIKTANLIFNRGYYDKLYTENLFIKYGGFIINYPATSLFQTLKDNKICYTENYLQLEYNYDVVLIDELDKLEIYKKIYKKTRNFMKLFKLGFNSIDFNIKIDRIYDIIYFGSTIYPTKNTNIFLDYLQILEKNGDHLKICFVSKFNDQLFHYQNIQVNVYNNIDQEQIKELCLQSKNNLILSGRDANPRIISESLSAGCFCICLNTLSDGYSIFEENPIFGKIIESDKLYISNNDSLSCLTDELFFKKITEQVLIEKNHEDIQNNFNEYINKNFKEQINKIIYFYKQSNKGTYILTLATKDYSKPLNYLLSSIKYSNPYLKVVIICINFTKELLNEFLTHYKDYIFFDYKLDNYKKGDILKLKVKMQKYFFYKYDKPFLWIDADTIVIKKLDSILINLWNHNLIVYQRFDLEDYMKFAVGVIGYGIGKDINITKVLLDEYNKSVLKTNGINDWFYDQLALWDVYCKFKDKISPYFLSENEHTLHCNNSSIILSRRSKQEKIIRDLLNDINCPISNIDFSDIKMNYDY